MKVEVAGGDAARREKAWQESVMRRIWCGVKFGHFQLNSSTRTLNRIIYALELTQYTKIEIQYEQQQASRLGAGHRLRYLQRCANPALPPSIHDLFLHPPHMYLNPNPTNQPPPISQATPSSTQPSKSNRPKNSKKPSKRLPHSPERLEKLIKFVLRPAERDEYGPRFVKVTPTWKAGEDQSTAEKG